MKKTDRIFDAFAGEIQKLGYELVDVEIANEQGSRVLTFISILPTGLPWRIANGLAAFSIP